MRSFAAAFLSLVLAAGLSGETRVVSTTIKGKTSISTTVIRRTPEGEDLRVEESGDEGSQSTLLSPDGTAKSVDIHSKDGEVRMVSDGSRVAMSGTWKGKAIQDSYELKGRGFYGRGFDFVLRAFAKGGCAALQFPMINLAKPSKTTVLELKKEGSAEFKGRPAIKVRVAPTGMLAAFWSAHLLMDEEGSILKFEGNQGPGTPDFVAELVEVRD